MMKTRDMPAHQMNYLRRLHEESRSDLNLVELERLVEAEASVRYRLLRYLNSAIFRFQSEIHSDDTRCRFRESATYGGGCGAE